MNPIHNQASSKPATVSGSLPQGAVKNKTKSPHAVLSDSAEIVWKHFQSNPMLQEALRSGNAGEVEAALKDLRNSAPEVWKSMPLHSIVSSAAATSVSRGLSEAQLELSGYTKAAKSAPSWVLPAPDPGSIAGANSSTKSTTLSSSGLSSWSFSAPPPYENMKKTVLELATAARGADQSSPSASRVALANEIAGFSSGDTLGHPAWPEIRSGLAECLKDPCETVVSILLSFHARLPRSAPPVQVLQVTASVARAAVESHWTHLIPTLWKSALEMLRELPKHWLFCENRDVSDLMGAVMEGVATQLPVVLQSDPCVTWMEAWLRSFHGQELFLKAPGVEKWVEGQLEGLKTGTGSHALLLARLAGCDRVRSRIASGAWRKLERAVFLSLGDAWKGRLDSRDSTFHLVVGALRKDWDEGERAQIWTLVDDGGSEDAPWRGSQRVLESLICSSPTLGSEALSRASVNVDVYRKEWTIAFDALVRHVVHVGQLAVDAGAKLSPGMRVILDPSAAPHLMPQLEPLIACCVGPDDSHDKKSAPAGWLLSYLTGKASYELVVKVLPRTHEAVEGFVGLQGCWSSELGPWNASSLSSCDPLPRDAQGWLDAIVLLSIHAAEEEWLDESVFTELLPLTDAEVLLKWLKTGRSVAHPERSEGWVENRELRDPCAVFQYEGALGIHHLLLAGGGVLSVANLIGIWERQEWRGVLDDDDDDDDNHHASRKPWRGMSLEMAVREAARVLESRKKSAYRMAARGLLNVWLILGAPSLD